MIVLIFYSFSNGMALGSLLNSISPGAINLERLKDETPLDNLNLCLEVAKNLGITVF